TPCEPPELCGTRRSAPSETLLAFGCVGLARWQSKQTVRATTAGLKSSPLCSVWQSTQVTPASLCNLVKLFGSKLVVLWHVMHCCCMEPAVWQVAQFLLPSGAVLATSNADTVGLSCLAASLLRVSIRA